MTPNEIADQAIILSRFDGANWLPTRGGGSHFQANGLIPQWKI